MKKIISLFQRNYDGDRLVRNEVVSGAEWVMNGEGTATGNPMTDTSPKLDNQAIVTNFAPCAS